MYNEDDYLLISGIQHFAFCRRQWALIHIENQWAENGRTTGGKLLHRNAHDAGYVESRGDCVVYRDLRVHSAALGLVGACDVVEFHRSASGITLTKREGLWQPFPVEYKRGEPKAENWDALQLCAEAMCLEEMLCCSIPRGALYYGQIRRREAVELTEEFRAQVKSAAAEMHEYYRRGYTPQAKPARHCGVCSLKELCLPRLGKLGTASEYLRKAAKEGDAAPA